MRSGGRPDELKLRLPEGEPPGAPEGRDEDGAPAGRDDEGALVLAGRDGGADGGPAGRGGGGGAALVLAGRAACTGAGLGLGLGLAGAAEGAAFGARGVCGTTGGPGGTKRVRFSTTTVLRDERATFGRLPTVGAPFSDSVFLPPAPESSRLSSLSAM